MAVEEACHWRLLPMSCHASRQRNAASSPSATQEWPPASLNRAKLELRFRRPTAGAFQLQRKTVSAMPEQQVAGPGEHPHTPKNGAGTCVSLPLIGDMQPQHIGMRSQAEMLRERRLQDVLGLLAFSSHRDLPAPFVGSWEGPECHCRRRWPANRMGLCRWPRRADRPAGPSDWPAHFPA
jgi:hypothetical protein